METVKKIQQFISYWYVRYLVVTELYMVDTWEQILVQVIFVILFGFFWCINYNILFNGISQLRSTSNAGVESILNDQLAV